MLNDNKITSGITIILLMVFLLGLNTVYAQKALKVLLDDGTIRNYSVSEITELTFVDDACNGVRSLTYGDQLYTTVQIGSQCWMEQNLNIGTRINSPSSAQSNNSTVEKYCYNNDEFYCNVFGGLYQWAEAVQYLNGASNTTSPNPPFSGNVQGICPSGWHIPTRAEFQTLSTNVGENSNSLKASLQGSGSGTGTNKSGFSGLLEGYSKPVFFITGFDGLGYIATFWSSREVNATDVNSISLYFEDDYIYFSNNAKNYGYSLRCLKD